MALWPDQHCIALGALGVAGRQAARDHGLNPAQADELKLGREACNVSPMATQPQLQGWHLQRLGLGGLQSPPQPQNPPLLALIDTGLSDSTAKRLGVARNDLLSRAPEPFNANLHRHGDAMAELMRSLAPQGSVQLESWRVIDGDGVGVIARVALALDEALARAQGALVVNMSLGWLPEQERSRRISDSCNASESGVGEVLRYMLSVAQARDSANSPTLIISAAGNRPLSGEQPELFRVEQGLPNLDVCTTGWWSSDRPPQLFPGEWSRSALDLCGGGPLLLSVGAVDILEQPSSLSIPSPGAEPPLVAPGQHVYLPNMAGPDLSPAFTGTSVASALTSGAAALILARLSEVGISSSGHQIKGLLYLSAVDLDRSTWGGLPVRRLDLERLEKLLPCAELPRILHCLEQAQDLSQTLSACGPLLSSCGLEAQSADPIAISGGLESWEEDPACEFQNFIPFEEACGEWQACENGNCVPCTGVPLFFGLNSPQDQLPREIMGAVGPQPEIPICPECGLILKPGSMEGRFDFNKNFPIGTRLKSPYLLLKDKAGQKAWLDMVPSGTQEYFSPGERALVAKIPYPTGFGTIISAQLMVSVEQWGKFKAWSTSALWIQ